MNSKHRCMRTRRGPHLGSARNRASGFTLVELLLVLVILALIGGLVLPGIFGKAEGAKVKAAGSQISRLAMAVESYYLDTGATPESLDLLVTETLGIYYHRAGRCQGCRLCRRARLGRSPLPWLHGGGAVLRDVSSCFVRQGCLGRLRAAPAIAPATRG